MPLSPESFGTGLGGPGMWDPMPLPPPVAPPRPAEDEKVIWAKPEAITPEPKGKARPAKRPARKRPAGKKRATKKKASKGRPVKKAARKKRR